MLQTTVNISVCAILNIKIEGHAYIVTSCCYSHLSSIASNFRNLEKNQILWYFPWKLCQEAVKFFSYLFMLHLCNTSA